MSSTHERSNLLTAFDIVRITSMLLSVPPLTILRTMVRLRAIRVVGRAFIATFPTTSQCHPSASGFIVCVAEDKVI